MENQERKIRNIIEEFLECKRKFLINYPMSERKKLRMHIFVSEVDWAINHISKKYQNLFIETFVKSNKFWWVDYYSPATFYRHRTESMEEFLRLYRK